MMMRDVSPADAPSLTYVMSPTRRARQALPTRSSTRSCVLGFRTLSCNHSTPHVLMAKRPLPASSMPCLLRMTCGLPACKNSLKQHDETFQEIRGPRKLYAVYITAVVILFGGNAIPWGQSVRRCSFPTYMLLARSHMSSAASVRVLYRATSRSFAMIHTHFDFTTDLPQREKPKMLVAYTKVCSQLVTDGWHSHLSTC